MFVKGVWKPTREVVVADEGREERVEVREGLGAGGLALEGVEEVDDLAEGRAEVLCGGAFGLAGGAGEADGEEVLEVPADAVDAEEAEVVNVHRATHVRFADFG